MITSPIPFPPVSWWAFACNAGSVTFDLAEHYQKMSYRNRYYLAAPDGRQLMSIPLEQGRNQRIPVGAVRISYKTNWQEQHWRTITSLYGRSPFFEHYADSLHPLFQKRQERLYDFCRESVEWACKALALDLAITETDKYLRQYPEDIHDIRERLKPQQATAGMDLPAYYQVFSDRCGFQPDCSVLDLLFNEGPHAVVLLQKAAPDLTIR